MLRFVSRKRPEHYKKVQRNVNRLKVLRTDADYSERMLSMSESEEAYRLARSVKLTLKEIGNR